MAYIRFDAVLPKMSGARIHPSAQIAETALIKGDVVIEEGAKIMDHAVVQGPAYIGKKTPLLQTMP